MRFRAGLVVGFAGGYYLGARAGRERFEQINGLLRKVKRSDAFETATDTAKDVVDLGVERAKDMVDSKLGDGDDPMSATPNPADPFLRSTSPPPDL